MDDLIRGPGSPISPKSIMMVSKVQENDTSHLATKFPAMHKAPDLPLGSARATTPEIKEPPRQDLPFHESSPCYHRFRATSSDVMPIMRTVLPIAPSMGERVYRVTMDDILVHNLGLEQTGSDLFVGQRLGGRVVVARMSPDEYGMFCTDEMHSQEVLVALRSFEVQVEVQM
jgi:hypothetical protein